MKTLDQTICVIAVLLLGLVAVYGGKELSLLKKELTILKASAAKTEEHANSLERRINR